MKKSKLFLYAISALILMLGFASCDECNKTNCQNGGICDEGDCVCTDEYEGINCETKKIAKFLGTYTVSPACAIGSDTGQNDGSTYSCEITEDPDVDNGIIFSNFNGITDAGATELFKGTVDFTTNVISIPAQRVFFTDYVAHTGTWVDGSVTFTYTYNDSGTQRNCIDLYVKN